MINVTLMCPECSTILATAWHVEGGMLLYDIRIKEATVSDPGPVQKGKGLTLGEFTRARHEVVHVVDDDGKVTHIIGNG